MRDGFWLEARRAANWIWLLETGYVVALALVAELVVGPRGFADSVATIGDFFGGFVPLYAPFTLLVAAGAWRDGGLRV